MSILFNGMGSSSGVDTGDIGHSLRCRAAANAYLSRTPASAGNRRTWTWSGWIKLGALGANQVLFNQGGVSTNYTLARLNANNQLDFHSYGGASYNFQKVTSAVFRDPTAFIHVMFVLDATNTQARIYVNGVEAAYTTNTNPANADQPFNQAALHYLGAATTPTQYLDGYMSRIAFVDGTALTPSSFGYLNTEINEWVTKAQAEVKAVVDAGGANSFMLDFDDATSLTTLGYDKSSKGNNWTLNNFSLTAGTTYDHMLDVPGNSYATLNPLESSKAGYSSSQFSNCNLTATNAAASVIPYGGPKVSDQDRVYWEVHFPTAAYQVSGFGVNSWNGQTGGAGSHVSFYINAGSMLYDIPGSVNNALTGTPAANDVWMFAYEKSTGKAWFGRQGVWYFSGDPAAGTGYVCTGFFGDLFVAGSNYTGAANYMFGQAPLHASATYQSAAGGYFRYTPPSGFKALCQRNLPDPAILNPEKHFDGLLHTGNGTSQNVTGSQFPPDFVWSKKRNAAYDHRLIDSVRGATKELYSSLTNAEVTDTGGLTAFLSNGFSVGNSNSLNQVSHSYVDWLWKAGGAPVANNNGSISSQVSANVLAGVSVVTCTMQPSGTATVGHGLGKQPALIIGKCKGNTSSWVVYHGALGASQYVVLNSTAALVGDTSVWNNVTPTSTVFSAGTAFAGLGDYVFYCFAEIPGFSKMGYYIGNSSTDGPYVECGFKPKYVLIKCISAAGNNWVIYDTARDTYNVCTLDLLANTTNAENQFPSDIDVTSTGFKVRGTSGDSNTNGATYSFYAIADVAGKFALGR